MKIAFDENIPPVLVKVFCALAREGNILKADIVSAREYAVPAAKSDVPWLEAFAKDGGKVVISGDKGMRSNLHEQQALRDAGFLVFFFEPRWNQQDPFTKSAILLKWWPAIQRAIRKTKKAGQFFEIPFAWNTDELKVVTEFLFAKYSIPIFSLI